MLSRLYDERVFTGSEDVVFSATSALAVTGRRHKREGKPPRRLENGSGEDASADDELEEEGGEEEEEEEETRRTAGLKFPLQSPRHLASSEQYVHRHHHHGELLAPTRRSRLASNHRELASNHRELVSNHRELAASEFMHKYGEYQVSERPMELVYLPTGEIRSRDECPPGLKLPPALDVRKLLAPTPTLKPTVERPRLNDSVASSTVPIIRQEPTRDRRGLTYSDEETKVNGRSHKTNKEEETSSDDQDHRDRRHGRRTKPVKQRSRAVDENERNHVPTSYAPVDELQREKKRVLEKMTQLLEEQGKTQALQLKVEEYEAKMKGMERKLVAISRQEQQQPPPTVSPHDGRLRDREERIKMLMEELRAKDELVVRLRQQVSEQNTARNREEENRVGRMKQRETAMASQLEELMNRVTVFHAQVETWKTNSREALESCDKRADVLDLLDEVWSDFPQFVGSSTDENKGAGSRAATSESSTTIRFLTKKLRQKEEELRVTHVKYVELKELCARQCIREADLQNFINDHRLRGNLVIRNPSNQVNQTNGGQHAVRDGQENHRRTANSYSNNQKEESGSDDDHEDDEEEMVPVRKPRVFIDIKRGMQQPSSNIEHVRLAPSPGLAQRYQQQQAVHQRTKSSSTATSRVPTVASASRTFATARKNQTRTTTTTMASRMSTMTQKRPPAAATRHGSVVAPSRRPSSQLAPRPWV